MFRCEVTGRVTEPREGMTKIVIETREKTYNNGVSESTGFEVVREMKVSPKGLEVWSQMSEMQKADFVKSLKSKRA